MNEEINKARHCAELLVADLRSAHYKAIKENRRAVEMLIITELDRAVSLARRIAQIEEVIQP